MVKIFVHFLIYMEARSSYMTLHPIPSEFPYLWGKKIFSVTYRRKLYCICHEVFSTCVALKAPRILTFFSVIILVLHVLDIVLGFKTLVYFLLIILFLCPYFACNIHIKSYKNLKICFLFLQKIYSEYELQGLEEDKLQCGQYQVHTERKRHGGR